METKNIMHSAIKKKTPFVSVIIPTFNRKQRLLQCMESLRKQDYPRHKYEIIIVDDGSQEAVSGYLSLRKKNSSIIRQPFNKGAAAARNMGLKQAKGRIVAFLDDDCQPLPNWLTTIIRTFDQYPDACAVGGSVLNAAAGPIAWASYIIEFSCWFPCGKSREVSNIPACNIAYRKKHLAGVFFPEDYKGAGFEDSLFNHRLLGKGKKIIFNPDIQVQHYKWSEGCSLDDFYQDQKRYALGFLKGGYQVFGYYGKLLMRYRVLNMLCPHIFLMFVRCLKAKKYLKFFILNFGLICRGEWSRNKMIYFCIRS